jgi:cysteine-rich repeat protein
MRALVGLVVALAIATPVPGQAQCPIAPGAYALTPLEGGFFVPGSFETVPLPPVAATRLEIGNPNADCVHPVVVPLVPTATRNTACLGDLGWTVQVTQTGCGVGLLDSDGGSDFSLEHIGDTSDTSPVCNTPHTFCQPGADDFVRSDVRLGDGTPDLCGQGGAAQLVFTVPLRFAIWSDAGGCPAPDGTFDAGTDTLVGAIPMTVNLTTGSAHAIFADLDGDGCFIAPGSVSALEDREAGSCLDPSTRVLRLAGAQPISTSGDVPLDDSVVGIVVPYRLSEAQPPSGATCFDPPPSPIAGGTATQCGETPGVANDVCEMATAIPRLPFTDVALTTDATLSPGEISPSCGFVPSSQTVWYRVTARQNATITASTLGSNYDTVLAAFTGSCERLTELACNDDFDSQQSLITFSAAAGETYYLAVGAPESAGTLRLFVDSSSPNCGNRTIEAGEGEECDDGNTDACDGCSPKCLIEICGDGIACFTQNEFCDDGNAVTGDGCAECRFECVRDADCRVLNCMEGECADTPLPGASLLRTCLYRRVPNCALCTHQSHCDDGDPCTADKCTVDGCQNSREPFADGFGAATCALKRLEAIDQRVCTEGSQRRLVCAECDAERGEPCYPGFAYRMNRRRAAICERLKAVCGNAAGGPAAIVKARAAVKRTRKELARLTSRIALHQAFAPVARRLEPECARLLFDRWTQAADQLRRVREAMQEKGSSPLDALCFSQSALRCEEADEARCPAE